MRLTERAKGLHVRASRRSRLLPIAVLSTVVLVDHDVAATDAPIAVGEVATPPPAAGVDAAALRDAAEGEIRRLDPVQLPTRRPIVVSLALTRAAVEGPITCTVNATLRDARTGIMIAIIEAGAQAAGPVSAEVQKQVANAAVRSAVQRIPRALGAK